MKRFLITALAAITLVLTADSMVIFEFPDGRNVAMTSSGEIEMVAESVSITPADSMYRNDWIPMMEAKCVFYLANTTDRPQDITVGFPIDAKFGDAYTVFSDSMLVAMYDSMYEGEDRSQWHSSGLEDGSEAALDVPEDLNFTAEAHGRPLEVFYRSCMYDLDEEMVHRPVVAVWRMHFEPQDTVRLVNTYRTAWDYYGGGPWSDYTIKYILTTGATWKGSIGSAHIELEVPEELPSPGFTDTLFTCWNWTGSPVVNGRTVTWEFTDLEPETNLRFVVNTEKGINHWDYSLSAAGLVENVQWTRDSLLPSTSRYITEELTWGPNFHTGLVFRLVEAALYLRRGQEPPSSGLNGMFPASLDQEHQEFTQRDLKKLELLEQVRQDIQEDIELVEQAGYTEFLPRFTLNYAWVPEHVRSYAGMPEKEEGYLHLLEYLEEAQTGRTIDDSAVQAFYRLTGWYNPGDSLYVQSDIEGALLEYLLERELTE
ncbi:MAG: hypothetical protein GF388_01610 [Candidatus Aegiribacteria sp.]|nr:hypothetical protein [Candidatus Aegiribacteria sp.]MBD3294070.1 hypothetical protein [Candidatus Fermentibacteria bacterium]